MINLVKSLSILLFVVTLSGCWNQGNCKVNFGTVSFGEQFKDLKEALEAEALTKEEYLLAKENILKMVSMCKGGADVEE